MIDKICTTLLIVIVLLVMSSYAGAMIFVSMGGCLPEGRILSRQEIIASYLDRVSSRGHAAPFLKTEIHKHVDQCCRIEGESDWGGSEIRFINKYLSGTIYRNIFVYYNAGTDEQPVYKMMSGSVSNCGLPGPKNLSYQNISKKEFDWAINSQSNEGE